MRIVWKLDEAVELCRILNGRLRSLGYAVALTGSVLTKGQSRKDLDLVVYPYTTAEQDLEAVKSSLMEFGMRDLVSVDKVRARWRKLGSADEKHVEVWAFGNRRIDLFFSELMRMRRWIFTAPGTDLVKRMRCERHPAVLCWWSLRLHWNLLPMGPYRKQVA